MSSERKMEIARIVVQMGKKEVPMSIEEAERLYKLLDKMFGEKVVERWYPSYPYRPYWYHQDRTFRCDSGSITYMSSNNTAKLCLDEKGVSNGIET